MRKIDEMYRISEGKCENHKCAECCNFIEVDQNAKIYFKCLLYSTSSCASSDWRKSYVACAWFNQERQERDIIKINAHTNDKKFKSQVEGQITIDEYFGLKI